MGIKTVCVYFLLMLVTTHEFPLQDSPVCPPKENTKSCECKNVAYGLHVVCSDLNLQSLQDALKELAAYRIGNLLLYNLKLKTHVPTNLFEGMKVNALHVENSDVVFDAPAFQGLGTSLGQLTITKCESVVNGSFSVAQLTNLKELTFKNNLVLKFSKSWFSNKTPEVTKAIFEGNSISAIENGALENLKNLKYVSFHNNRLTQLTRNILPNPANSLLDIDFSSNMLTTLPEDMFQNMPNLQTAVFSLNDLKMLPATTWSGIWSTIHKLVLIDNPIPCDKNLDWIKKVRKPVDLQGTCVVSLEIKKDLKKFISD